MRPEQQKALDEALRRSGQMIYGDDKGHSHVVKQLKSSTDMGRTIGDSAAAIVKAVDRSMRNSIPGGLILPIARKVVGMLVDAAQKFAGKVVEESDLQRAMSIAFKTLGEIYRSGPGARAVLQQAGADKVKRAAQMYDGTAGGKNAQPDTTQEGGLLNGPA